MKTSARDRLPSAGHAGLTAPGGIPSSDAERSELSDSSAPGRAGDVDERFPYCLSCDSHHMAPVPCGLSFRDRIRSISIDPGSLETKDKRNYYDREAVKEVFGEDSRERMLEETRGLGPIKRAADGSEWVNDDPKTGELRPLERSDLIGGYLRGHGEDW